MSAQWMKSWLFRLLRNLIEFATVAVPGASLVHYLKRAKFLDAFKQDAEQVESDDSEDEEDDSEDDRDVVLRLLNGPDYDEEDDDDEDYIYDEEEEDDEESDDDNEEDEEWDDDNDGEDNEQLQTQKDEKENESATVYGVHKYQDLKHYMLSEEVIIPDQQFKAEQVILKDKSTFHQDTKEIATGVMVTGDREPSAFQYCSSLDKLTLENVFLLYKFAADNDAKDLKERYFEFIKNNLSTETFCETYNLCLQYQEIDLLKLAEDFFAINVHNILTAADWVDFFRKNPVPCSDLIGVALKYWTKTDKN